MREDPIEKRKSYERYFREHLYIDDLKQSYPYDHGRIDEILDLLVDTVCSTAKTIRCAGEDRPAEVVKSRFMKVLWLLGEMGLIYPQSVQDVVPTIVSLLDSLEPLLRERAVNSLGRIGRGGFHVIEPYWVKLFSFASDEEPRVRLAFIWASENIATNTPDIYENYMSVFEKLLHDADDKVRMEAPEIFRVLGKRRPEFVKPYVEQLREISETDENRVVRIHCLGAVKTVNS
jgi:HEAT repeat protein